MVDERKFRCRVVRIYQGYEKTQIIQYGHQGKSLYTSGMFDKFIEENKIRDICLAACDAGAVTVTDRTGKLRFRYNGTTSSLKGDQFCPFGIATDSAANILVYNTFMIHIHVMDKDGKLIRFLNIVCPNPMRFALDEDDYLYIADKHGNVKIVQYLEQEYSIVTFGQKRKKSTQIV